MSATLPVLRHLPHRPHSIILTISLSVIAIDRLIDRLVDLLSNVNHPSHLAQLHAFILSSGLHRSSFLATKFLLATPESHHLALARHVFDQIPHPKDNFLFNAVIRLHSRRSSFGYALRFYSQMLCGGLRPDGFTFPPVLKACGGALRLVAGRAVHGQVLRFGFKDDLFVDNGIVAMYAKCGDMDCARKVFGGLRSRNVVSWTSVVSGSAQNGFPMEALCLFREMRLDSDVRPDFIVFVSVLKAYMDVGDLENGRSVHGLVVKSGLCDEPDLIVMLTAMYAKCGQVVAARSLFECVVSDDVILWNAMISGYAKNGHASEAVELFRKMISRGMKSDSVTIRSAIMGCAQLGSMDTARWMEDYVNNSEFKDDTFVNTTLIDMYAKCGSVAHPHRIFNRIQDKDVVVWSAIIMSYGLHGHGREAINLFSSMEDYGVNPNDVTFVALLAACNHAGLVGEGRKYFHYMAHYKIEPRHQHYACLVDLIARAGYLDEAYEFVRSMPIEPGLTVWGALLNACKKHGHVEMGEYVAERIFALEPQNAGHYVQLSNIYASVGMWKDVARIRVLMKERGVRKETGCSSIEINGKLYYFRAGDKSHPRYLEILSMLAETERKLQEAGFVPDLGSVLHDLNMEEVEDSLSNHSERIAIAFGLISTAPGTTLRIIKNLRACVNCHSAMKLISLLYRRKIVVRDINRFHHIEAGVCSCRDYW